MVSNKMSLITIFGHNDFLAIISSMKLDIFFRKNFNKFWSNITFKMMDIFNKMAVMTKNVITQIIESLFYFLFYSSQVQEEEQFSRRASRSLNLDAWSPL